MNPLASFVIPTRSCNPKNAPVRFASHNIESLPSYEDVIEQDRLNAPPPPPYPHSWFARVRHSIAQAFQAFNECVRNGEFNSWAPLLPGIHNRYPQNQVRHWQA